MSKVFRPPTSATIAAKIKTLSQPDPAAQYMVNRNPRNLERLRIAYRIDGYHLEQPGRSYWHKLELTVSQRFVSATLRHFENGIVISASTSENAVKQQLSKFRDTKAFINLARVFAQRCHEAGLIEMRCDIKSKPDGKIDKFLQTLKENGITLSEPDSYKLHRHWNIDVPEKPWEVDEKDAV